MAEESKRSFPSMPAKHWWALRDQFKRSIPTQVDAGYVASVLGMAESSARANVLPSLRATGLIGGDGKPTQRAVRWRDDHHYGEVCEEMRNDLYPDQLVEIAPTADDRPAAERWFANNTGAGQSAVFKMTSFYLTLVEADPTRGTLAGPRPAAAKRTTTRAKTRGNKKPSGPTPPAGLSVDESRHERRSPSFHLNVQIHISADASAEQVDRIFESMARHLESLLP